MKSFILFLVVAGSFFIVAKSQEAETSLSAKPDFPLMKNKHEESRAWASCSAAYLVYADILSADKPATAKQVKNLSNGATLASQISLFMRSLDDSPTKDEFAAAWEASALTRDSNKEVAYTALLSEFELAPETALKELDSKLTRCADNLKHQQAYVETYREMVSTGLLSVGE